MDRDGGTERPADRAGELMNAKLSERRAPMGQTQRAVLDLLKSQGPMQRWQIRAVLGKSCDTSIQSLVKAGNIAQLEDANLHPDPAKKQTRAVAVYCHFVRDLDKAAGVSERTLKWAARVLRAAGYAVVAPR